MYFQILKIMVVIQQNKPNSKVFMKQKGNKKGVSHNAKHLNILPLK